MLKVAAANSSANVLAMLLDWTHQDKKSLDLQLVCLALAEACESDNSDAMQLLLGSWVGQCTALQAQPLLRAFAARGDAMTVGKLLSRGPSSMVTMDSQQHSSIYFETHRQENMDSVTVDNGTGMTISLVSENVLFRSARVCELRPLTVLGEARVFKQLRDS